MGAFAHLLLLLGAVQRHIVQCLCVVGVARLHIAQGVRAVGRQHVGDGAQGGILRDVGMFGAQRITEFEQIQRRFAGAYIAPRLQVRQAFDQGLVHLPLFLLLTPVFGMVRQHHQGRKRAHGGVADGEDRQQHKQHHVQRQINPVGVPKKTHHALVVPREQGHGNGQSKQPDKPKCGAHHAVVPLCAQRPAAAVDRAAKVSSRPGC